MKRALIDWGLRIGLLSDTHGFLDPALFTYFEHCDEVWHAGDVGPAAVLEQLRAFRPVRAVYGNIDGPDVRETCEEHLHWTAAGLGVYMTHIGGYPGAYDRRARAEIDRRRPGLFICGHSHILKVLRDPERGLVHLNPGAAGRHGWHKVRTALRFSIEDGKLCRMEAIELGPRSASADMMKEK